MVFEGGLSVSMLNVIGITRNRGFFPIALHDSTLFLSDVYPNGYNSKLLTGDANLWASMMSISDIARCFFVISKLVCPNEY